MTRIAIEVSNLARPHKSGVAVYGTNLVRQLARLDTENSYFLCYRLSRLKSRLFFLPPPGPNFRVKIIQEPLSRIFLGRMDIYHGLDGRVCRGGRAKRILTVHDVLHYTDAFPVSQYPERRIRRFAEMLARADRVVADSESGRQEILRYFPLPERKIRVIRLGVEERFQPQEAGRTEGILRRYGIRPPYLLYVGCLESRKNLGRVLEAFAQVRRAADGTVRLVLAGEAGEGGEEVPRTIGRLGLAQAVSLPGYVRDEDLPYLYSGALGFLYLSLYEGFGLPVLEAMACGTPVVTSEASALPEVAGDAALLVDPRSVAAIAAAMERLLRTSSLREEYRRRGIRRAALFTWEKTATETLDLYREVLRGEPSTESG